MTFENSIVPVTHNFDQERVLGRAHLRKDGDRVVAVLELDDEPPEDTRVPAMGGLMTQADPKVGLVITDVGLASNNIDPRIGPIEEVNDGK